MNLKPGSHIHLMGICGTAMASLAGLLKDRGFQITGSDSNPYPPMSTQLESLGISIMKPYRAENLNPKPDFVIVGNVISKTNPEAAELLKSDIPFTSLPQAMGEFIIEDRESIVIAGTHGKTTTTSLMSWVATELGVQPGFLIGGIAKNFSKSFQNPRGNYFVIEGDEYDTAFFDKVPKFTHYRPKHVILTSVEFDHADIYKDLDAVKSAFRLLLKKTPKNGTFLYWGEDANIRSLIADCLTVKKYSYGFQGCDYLISGTKTQGETTEFKVSFQGSDLGIFHVPLSGQYNVLNATAVIGLCHQQGWDLEKVKVALKSFLGVKRRQEVLGEPRGILVIEDFAHHPTAVKETLRGLKEKYPGRRVHAIFEPRSATSRRKVFQKDYVQAFKQSEFTYLAQAFDTSKIDESERFSSQELSQDLREQSMKAHDFATVDEIVNAVTGEAKPGDMVVVMSNGGFEGIYQKLLLSLEKGL
ncbi:MAG: UDP-N-acetylmuramate:L-alanyl-gamma-D-glutamyl-meso-diaminopimelate ligase [Proteobacteria bacterium]|jgi:UDP-N-acetylmuramate: L-alanyl-gamma-D-glutamyl-meso-diaminopimelate ligase|nr:UDP-N-acetylmuramate:L-alanyl-gamma-D-glutamyl-meso-diaminopimelate ligase [Pseudomonadota bacterium]